MNQGAASISILFFILLVVLIATFGFWDTLAAVLGAAALIVLAVVLGVAAAGVAAMIFLKREKGR